MATARFCFLPQVWEHTCFYIHICGTQMPTVLLHQSLQTGIDWFQSLHVVLSGIDSFQSVEAVDEVGFLHSLLYP